MSDFFQQSSTLFPAGIESMNMSRLALILIIGVIIIIGVYVYKWYMKRKKNYVEILGPYGLATERLENPWTSLTTAEDAQKLSSANNTTFSFFSYIEKPTSDLNPLISPEGEYGNLQYSIVLGHTLGIKLDPIHQLAVVDIYNVSVPGGTEQNQIVSKKSIVVENIPIQRWNQITITIEGRTVDIYVNGSLVTSTLLENIPFTEFFGIWLNKSPDFEGQVCYFQMWPERRTASQIQENYQQVTDIRGKPLIPDFRLKIKDLFRSFCSNTGICGVQFKVGPLKYINYEFA
jgi:hypothetical protein